MTTNQHSNWLLNIAHRFSVLWGILALVATVYFGFFYDDGKEQAAIDNTQAAIREYISNPTDNNARLALEKLNDCFTAYSNWDCDDDLTVRFVSVMARTSHIDIVFERYPDTIESIFNYTLNHRLSMAAYTGQRTDALQLKAKALIRDHKVAEALTIFKELFNRGERWSVATSLRSLLTHYGCTDDVAIWGEFSEDKITQDYQPPGTAYPEQPKILSIDEFVDRRIRLQKGEFVSLSEKCPITLLSTKAKTLQ